MKLKKAEAGEGLFSFTFSKERGMDPSGPSYRLKKPEKEKEARREGAHLCDFMRKSKLRAAFIDLSSLPLAIQSAFLEGALLSDYSFSRYRSKPPEELELSVKTDADLDRLEKIRDLVFFTRDIINEPPGQLTPSSFAEKAEELEGVEVKVYRGKQLEELNLAGTLAVGNGSSQPPVFIELRYRPEKSEGKVALVGKGVTFDSGGINLKPSSALKGMHMDMAGAGVVLGIFKAVSFFPCPYELVGFIPLAENMPSGSALKPGDIIKFKNGKTVEIMNTDAEGRLLLADALIMASEEKPDFTVDLATLTGAAIVALGELYAALLSNDRELASRIKRASEETGEMVWELPLAEEYKEDVESKRADLKNADYGKGGGTIKAALFLSEFIRGPWAHLDIAGPAMLSKKKYYLNEGATAFGLRLLARLLKIF